MIVTGRRCCAPASIVSEDGTLICNAMLAGGTEIAIDRHIIVPRKPIETAPVGVNGRMCGQFLNETVFAELHNAPAKVPTWLGDDEPPHVSLKDWTPPSCAPAFTATHAHCATSTIARRSTRAARCAKAAESNYSRTSVRWQVKLRRWSGAV